MSESEPSTLIPFKVYTDDTEDGSELVWAIDATQAIEVARKGPLFSELEDTELYARDIEPLDGTAPAAGTDPHIENRDRVLREYGWSCDGDDRCESCGLATMDGAFPICADCETCEDCGHAADCPRGLLLGAQAERFGEIAGRLIYIAAPYRGEDAAQVQRHLARVGLLNRLLIRLFAHPITLHGAIHAGHYGDDSVSAERVAGLEVASAIARRIHDAGGGVIALEREGGGMSDGTGREVQAANHGRVWRPTDAAAVPRWGTTGREPQPGIAVLRWRDLGPAFKFEGLGREWEILCATAVIATGGEVYPCDPTAHLEGPTVGEALADIRKTTPNVFEPVIIAEPVAVEIPRPFLGERYDDYFARIVDLARAFRPCFNFAERHRGKFFDGADWTDLPTSDDLPPEAGT